MIKIHQMMKWRLEKREHTSFLVQTVALFAGLAAALGLSALLIATAKADIGVAFGALFRGAFGSWYSISETLLQATPLIYTGLAVLIAFRAKIFNIGAEGQFFAGAMASFWVSVRVGSLPPPLAIFLVILAALAGGAFYGAIPGILKSFFGANEIIVSVMLNYVILYFLSYMISNHWRAPDDFYLQTMFIPEAARLPTVLPKSRVHLGFLLAIIACVVMYYYLWKTPSGFEIRALGESRSAAQYKGINTRKTILVVLILSGAIAGLAGGGEIAGIHHRLRLDISTGYGYTGIIIALLGRLNPVGVLIAAIFFGGLVNGSTSMQISAGVPVALVYSVQALVLICVIAAEVLATYRIRRLGDVE